MLLCSHMEDKTAKKLVVPGNYQAKMNVSAEIELSLLMKTFITFPLVPI